MSDKKDHSGMGRYGRSGRRLGSRDFGGSEWGLCGTRDYARRQLRQSKRTGRHWVRKLWRATSTTKEPQEGVHRAYGVFGVTFFWAHFSPAKEIAHATSIAAAARPPASSTSSGRASKTPANGFAQRQPHAHPAGHLQGAAFRRQGDPTFSSPKLGLPLTILLASFYWDNAIYFGMGPHRGEDNKLALHAPDGRQELAALRPAISANALTASSRAAATWIGKTVVSRASNSLARNCRGLCQGLR